MLQQIVVDPIRSRCTGFGLNDWPPQISQSERLVVNFSVVWGEVNFVLLLLLFYGLGYSTVVGRGGVVCKCCCMFISNIFRVGDGSTILPILVLLGRADILPDIFLTLSHTCLMGVSADSFETYSAHDLRSSCWRVDGLAPAIFWKLTDFPLWIIDFVRLSCPGLA